MCSLRFQDAKYDPMSNFHLFGQQPRYVDPLNATAMACPAFPLCPLAITEAERGIPDILKRVRAVFEKVESFICENYCLKVVSRNINYRHYQFQDCIRCF